MFLLNTISSQDIFCLSQTSGPLNFFGDIILRGSTNNAIFKISLETVPNKITVAKVTCLEILLLGTERFPEIHYGEYCVK